MAVFRYAAVDTAEALTRWASLRTELYLDADLITASDLNDRGLYTDAYDRYSTHYLAYAGSDSAAPIGTCRLIDGELTRLKVVSSYGLAADRPASEISGLTMAAEHRKSFATIGFYKLIFDCARLRGHDDVYMELEEPFLDVVAKLGFPITVLSEPRWTYRTWNVAVRIHVPDVVASIHAADARRGGALQLGPFFESPFSGVLDTDTLVHPAPAAAL